jgi:hypothetical protein
LALGLVVHLLVVAVLPLCLQGIPYSLQVGVLAQAAAVAAQLLDLMGSQGSTRWLDSSRFSRTCSLFLPKVLPLADCKALRMLKFAAAL